MEKKKFITRAALTIASVAVAVTACGPKPEPTIDVSHELASCGKEAESDIPVGGQEQFTAAEGGSTIVRNNDDGTVTINGVTMNSAPNTIQVGEVITNHLEISIQGDPDGDSKLNVLAKSVCPAPKPTPTPTPTPTPISRKNNFANRGFQSQRSSHAARTVNVFQGRGRIS